ncbi:MAG: hypothetical protein HY334_00095 [Armatimonadetes bacterium]|nr:hypothetical protein [Armatimonadota bacterium]
MPRMLFLEVMRVRAALLSLLLIVSALPVWAGPGERPEPSPGVLVLGDGVIVPGQRVGPLRLAMTVNQIIDAIGTVYKREEFKEEKIILYEWRAEGIWLSLNAQTKATRVISAFGANGKYLTDKGVRLLDRFTKAEEVYGKTYKRWEYPKEKVILIRYPALGLQFGVVNDPSQTVLIGRIFQIGIFKPGDLPPVRQP